MSGKRFSVHFQRFEHLGFTSTDAGGRNSTSASAEHYRDETQTERGLQGLAPKNERISLCSVNVYERYSSRLDLWWKGRQTWHSWYWTAVQLWGCIHEGPPKCWCGTAFPRHIPGHAVCLNATRLQEQGCFILDREEMNEKRALFVMLPLQLQKRTAPLTHRALQNKGMQSDIHFHTAQERGRIRLASESRDVKEKN